MDIKTEAVNGRAPESIEELDFENLDNLDGHGLDEDVDAVDADDDEDLDLFEDDMENPLPMQKSEGDEDDDDGNDHLNKADDDDDEDSDDDEDDDKDGLKKEVAKGGLTAGNLNKSIRNLAAFVESRDPSARKASLLRRAQLGKSLSKSERTELMAIIAGRTEAQAPARSLTKSLQGNRRVQRGLDESEAMTAQHVELVKALSQVERGMGQMASRNTEFDLLLAKAVADIGQEVKRLSKSMDRALTTPSRAPKSMGAPGARPLAKSHMGDGQAPRVSHEEIERGFSGLLQKSIAEKRGGMNKSGTVNLLQASTHYDSCGQVLPEIQSELSRYIRENR